MARKKLMSFTTLQANEILNPEDAESTGSIADPVTRELKAESITVIIRWFGVVIGYLIVNFGYLFGASRSNSRTELNALLAVGAVYALIDTLRSRKGEVLLAEFRILVSLMEALFIGLLCYFDEGISSPFRFYYFLSLLVCAIRHTPALTFATPSPQAGTVQSMSQVALSPASSHSSPAAALT